MRRSLAAAVVVAILVPSTAAAALEVRLSVVPATPRAGRQATIELRPFSVESGTGQIHWSVVRYPFRVQALGSGRRSMTVRALRTRDPYRWRARLRFAVAGRWEIRVANYYYSDRCRRRGCVYRGPRLRLTVKPG